MTNIPQGHLYLGGVLDTSNGERTDEAVHLEASDLTTHGVIVGMTGSGKTGLSVIMLEEAPYRASRRSSSIQRATWGTCC